MADGGFLIVVVALDQLSKALSRAITRIAPTETTRFICRSVAVLAKATK